MTNNETVMEPPEQALKPRKKHFVGIVKVIVEAESEQAAVLTLRSAMTNPPGIDYGFLNTGGLNRAFFHQVDIDPAYFELRDIVMRDREKTTGFESDKEERAIAERNDAFEAWFDSI